jgi:cell division protein FtsQ
VPKPAEKKPRRFRARTWLAIGAFLTVFVSTALAARTIEGFLTHDPRFFLNAPTYRVNDGISILGATNTSLGSVQQVFTQDYGRSVYDIPIAERRRRLLAVDWIQDASVSRVWPNRIIVRVHERKPVAFVNVPHESVLLVDAEGVLLSPPPRANFELPVLSGVWIAQSEPERKVRVQAALRLLDDLGPASSSVSEVNATSPDDLRVMADIDGKTYDLWLGDTNFGSRFHNFTEHLADLRAGSPNAKVFDLRIDDRITAR